MFIFFFCVYGSFGNDYIGCWWCWFGFGWGGWYRKFVEKRLVIWILEIVW